MTAAGPEDSEYAFELESAGNEQGERMVWPGRAAPGASSMQCIKGLSGQDHVCPREAEGTATCDFDRPLVHGQRHVPAAVAGACCNGYLVMHSAANFPTHI